MYNYVLQRRLGELEFYGYEKERKLLKSKIDELHLDELIANF